MGGRRTLKMKISGTNEQSLQNLENCVIDEDHFEVSDFKFARSILFSNLFSGFQKFTLAWIL